MIKNDCREFEAMLAPLQQMLADALASHDRRGVSEALAGQICVVASQVEVAYRNLRRAMLVLNTRALAEGDQLNFSLDRINEIHAALRRSIDELCALVKNFNSVGG